MDFLELKKNTGKDESRARDLFYAMWIPDLFMETVDTDGDWYLMDPKQSPGLADVYGDDFVKLYNKYVEDNKYRKKVKAREVWSKILELQIETGTPYILYKDVINSRSNQKNIGVIKSSNLCVAGETLIKCKIDGIEKEIEIQKLRNIFYSSTEIEVLSFNLETKEDEWKKITKIGLTNPNAEVLKITDDETGFYIVCTEEHQIWTENRGYILAKDIKENDILKIVKNLIFV